jgi:hypothetical protein
VAAVAILPPLAAHVEAMRKAVAALSPSGARTVGHNALARAVYLAFSGHRPPFTGARFDDADAELWGAAWLWIVPGTRLLELDAGLRGTFLTEIGGLS